MVDAIREIHQEATPLRAIRNTVEFLQIIRDHGDTTPIGTPNSLDIHKRFIENGVSKFWNDLSLGILQQNLDNGERIVGFEIGGENWRISTTEPNPETDVYVKLETLKEAFVLSGGSTQEAEKLFPNI